MHFTRAPRIPLNPSLSFLKFCLFTIFLIFLHAQPGLADTIYRSINPHGRILYSDIPTPTAKPLQLAAQPVRSKYRVTRVIDGDTVVLENNKRVRLLGVNAPEIENRFHPAEPGGIEAKKWLQGKLQGRSVYLEHDRQTQDHYKRMLAHLYLADGEHINLSLVEKGLAVVTLISPNLLHANTLIKAQQRAEAKKLGIWSMKQYQPRQLVKLTEKPFGWQRYRVKVTALKRNRRFSRLIIGKNIDISIANQDLALFPPLETYLNKPLEVRGWVSRKKNHFSIRIQHPSALILH
ncbi:Endonuclease YncB, thermonuclease family [Nitrosomonas eutropha]|uniref:thermonuclease family protein n=1 Tax=Nitrosomonas TaxID=914 RepID=UPI00089466A0|nr:MULTISPECIES: thermonuclease family protein [Nitrosomonas]MXS81050.1 nuclease [Nitrosomonas sp. GH22]SDW37515.1 Endonuclease YncB, thermonuclease family [Nitrosomonas eutropha]